ncbi:ABC transporter ATP-binding protein [Burkholderia sp. SFA1]|uniref:ABC transporter ATP-binding protein n=1 Tax=Caballeronia sp. CLC5 TaxID=2906764 RepID=UPI001F44B8DF|nr:ABC transporter ATP-binding protein [Caballeronia sp. CLC5]MCE4573766.1 ABC transporter ATP-binding protein [Caballeronia sp. CLC5]BBQ00611.1 ABC transporter ATP-binding protein [Burkholderia sp. SFA1]
MTNARAPALAMTVDAAHAQADATRAATQAGVGLPLRAQGLTVAFGGLTAVRQLDLDVQEHEIHALIGPNGAGKTTVVNALSGFVRLTAGRVWINGASSPHWRSHTLARAGLGRTFQNTRLFGSMNVLETVLVGAHSRFDGGALAALLRTKKAREQEKAAVADAHRLIEFVGLGADAATKQASALSYGHQRRVELARALIAEPRVLLLDEPLAGMNVSEKLELSELIRQIRASGVAILLIEHDMDVIRNLADRVTVLHFGSKLIEGTPQAVLAHDDVQSAYLGKRT